MQKLFYRVLMLLARCVGIWLFRVGAWCVATGYFILFPRRVAASMAFYKALFPSRGLRYHVWCAWGQFHAFTSVFLDRWRARTPGRLTYTDTGREYLAEITSGGAGAILLMSHLGNWEIGAAYLAASSSLPSAGLLLYLGEKQGEQIESQQKRDLAGQGVRVIASRRDEVSPFDLLEGVRFLQDGGFVSMTGDRLWSESQRSVPVTFLGHEARLPEAPFQLALVSGAPLIIFFVIRAGGDSYHCTLFKPLTVAAASRDARARAIREAAQTYAGILESMVRRHPLEWYHFERFTA